MRCGIENTTRDVPLKVHQLTGCDITSKYEIKTSGMKTNPLKYLRAPQNVTGNLLKNILCK